MDGVAGDRTARNSVGRCFYRRDDEIHHWRRTGGRSLHSAISSGDTFRGRAGNDRIACPDFTGSYLSYDGENLYLSQSYKGRILKLDRDGNILRVIEVGGEVSGHAFVDGTIYVLRGTEQDGETWALARLNPKEETPEVENVARMSFACRSLTFDGEHFWSNHRAGDEIVQFGLPR